MARIDDWQLNDPVHQLVQRLNQLDSRNTEETTEALVRLIEATQKCQLEVEIAAQRWIIQTSQNNQRAAREELDRLQQDYAERFPDGQ